MKKLNNEKMQTFVAKTNYYGNRLTLVLNHEDKTLYINDGYVGSFGETKEKMLQRDIKAIKKTYLNDYNYKNVTHKEMFIN